MEDRGLKVEDGGLKIEDGEKLLQQQFLLAILHHPSSILDYSYRSKGGLFSR